MSLQVALPVASSGAAPLAYRSRSRATAAGEERLPRLGCISVSAEDPLPAAGSVFREPKRRPLYYRIRF